MLLKLSPTQMYLKAINVHSEDKGKKMGSDAAYQDSVTAPLDGAHDKDIMRLQDKDEDDVDNAPVDLSTSAKLLKETLTAIEKVNSLLSV
jgi:hypothetical protein